MNGKFNLRIHKIRAVISKIGARFLTFKKGQGRPPPSFPLVAYLDIAPSKKASKKCDTFKNTQTNELIKEARNTLKNLNELETQHSSSKTADDIFCEMIAVHLKNMNEGAAKEFLKLDIHRGVITAIHHNSGLP